MTGNSPALLERLPLSSSSTYLRKLIEAKFVYALGGSTFEFADTDLRSENDVFEICRGALARRYTAQRETRKQAEANLTSKNVQALRAREKAAASQLADLQAMITTAGIVQFVESNTERNNISLHLPLVDDGKFDSHESYGRLWHHLACYADELNSSATRNEGLPISYVADIDPSNLAEHLRYVEAATSRNEGYILGRFNDVSVCATLIGKADNPFGVDLTLFRDPQLTAPSPEVAVT